MTVEYRTGDLFEQVDLDAIGHGVNCMGKMGSGIAVLFKNEFPEMYESYAKLCEQKKLKLGMVYPWHEEELELWVFNLATQFKTGRNADLDAVRMTVKKMLAFCEKKCITSVGLPQIGSGIGGLNWREVSKAIEEIADQSSVNVVLMTLG